MSTFDSTKTSLVDLLNQIVTGKIQLPDFQRGWVWDDAHIRSLLTSVARSFPIGSIMLLETGGVVRFQTRSVEGVTLAGPIEPERLILDGQQRLTSLAQVLKSDAPAKTKDEKGRDVQRLYFIDIEKALSDRTLEDAIVALDETLTQRANFGRDVILDLSSREREFDLFHFPCTQILNANAWEMGLFQRRPEKFARYMEFRESVLTVFRSYLVPVIELKKETSKEAVCLVFEKVNTGGISLNVFELVTATYAADSFNLREDWYGKPGDERGGRHRRLAGHRLLADVEPTEFLQGLSLLHKYQCRLRDLADGKTGKAVTAVSAKREDVLDLPLAAYRDWSEKLTQGFLVADQFLRAEGFYTAKFLPYRSQLIPLAAVMTHLGERWMEPRLRDRIARWFWCGVLGELYGGSIETRIANDFQQLIDWMERADAQEPGTVTAAGFQPSRLDTLRSRTSAAYRGIYVLLQRSGARDFYWKARMTDVDRDEYHIDIHHIFPQKWCDDHDIPPRVYNSIVNKTAISYKANRMIGGKAPSDYLVQLRDHESVRISDEEQDAILVSHFINPVHLRGDDFQSFFNDRRSELLGLIAEAMGKGIAENTGAVAEDEVDYESDTAAA